MHMANCEHLLLSISCEMNADQSLFVMELNERLSNRTNLVWSIVISLTATRYYTRKDAENSMRYVNGTRLDDRIVRTDWDVGFKEGRQYGRGKTGGQVNTVDENGGGGKIKLSGHSSSDLSVYN